MNSLFQGLPANLLREQSESLFGAGNTATLTLPETCSVCSLNLTKADALRTTSPLGDKMTSASAKQLLTAFAVLSDTSLEPGRLAYDALVANQDYTGLARYLVRAPWIAHCSVETDTTREEVLLIDKGLNNKWGVVMLFSSHLPSRVRVDSLPNRLFSEVGWRLFCYFDAMPALSDLSLPAVPD